MMRFGLTCAVSRLVCTSLTGTLAATSAASANVPPPRLAVVIVVDGLPASHFETMSPWFAAGLARLREHGAVFTSCSYRHINTETGPGHASIATGAPPRVHGIVANHWFRSNGGTLAQVYCTTATDPATGREVKQSPANLRVETLGDRLVGRSPASRVVSLAGKDRAAIMMAGRSPQHAVYWYDGAAGSFASSSAYPVEGALGTRAAAIVGAFNRASGGDRLLGRIGPMWRPLPAGRRSGPQPVPPLVAAGFQVPVNGLLFDHDLTRNLYGYFLYPSRYSEDYGIADLGARKSGFSRGVYQSPFIDELTADLAVEFLADRALALGRGPATDMLWLSFSAHDTVSHNYGIESVENLDVLRRLDLHIGRLVAALDQRVGSGRWVVAFTADHGFNVIPELAHHLDPHHEGGRIVDSPRSARSFSERLNRRLCERLCLPAGSLPIATLEGFSLVYNGDSLPLRSVSGPCGPAGRAVDRGAIDDVIEAAVRDVAGEEVADVYLTSQFREWPPDRTATEFVVNDFDTERSGDAFIVPRPGVIAHDDPGRGSGHGSHHAADTDVPLIFLGSGVEARRLPGAATPYDIAPTLARYLGLDLPQATGRDLGIFGRPARQVGARTEFTRSSR